jgi:hypothetical protein
MLIAIQLIAAPILTAEERVDGRPLKCTGHHIENIYNSEAGLQLLDVEAISDICSDLNTHRHWLGRSSTQTHPTGSRVALERIYTSAQLGPSPRVKTDGAGSQAFLPHDLEINSFAWRLRTGKFNLHTSVHFPSTVAH